MHEPVRALIDGLRAALDELAERHRRHGLPVRLETEGELAPLPAAVEVVAYRVASEALASVEKHANATAALLRVTRDERHLELVVRDDGRGFDGNGGAGVGLASIRDRAEELGGTCAITSGADGTSMTLLLPLSG